MLPIALLLLSLLGRYVSISPIKSKNTDPLCPVRLRNSRDRGFGSFLLQRKSRQQAALFLYIYVAMLDRKTSEMCRDHDGPTDPATKKPYTYKKKKMGENFPPLHPNCRSTTCAFVSEEILKKMTRKAVDENGNVVSIPADMTYRQWEENNPKASYNTPQHRNRVSDMKQYEAYKSLLDVEVPKEISPEKIMPSSFEAFQKLKYEDVSNWDKLKQIYREVSWMKRCQQNGITTGTWHKIPDQAPNTVADKYSFVNGTMLLTRRYFGKNGKPVKDIDLTDHLTPKQHTIVPHVHTIDVSLKGSYHKGDAKLSVADWIANYDIFEKVRFVGYK